MAYSIQLRTASVAENHTGFPLQRADPAPDAPGTTIPSRSGAASSFDPQLEPSTLRSVTSVSHAAPTAAAFGADEPSDFAGTVPKRRGMRQTGLSGRDPAVRSGFSTVSRRWRYTTAPSRPTRVVGPEPAAAGPTGVGHRQELAWPAGKPPNQTRRTRTVTTGPTLGFEAQLWAMADKLRGHMDAAAYKPVMRVATQAPDRKMLS